MLDLLRVAALHHFVSWKRALHGRLFGVVIVPFANTFSSKSKFGSVTLTVFIEVQTRDILVTE